jgi:putative hydrolase of the HAD superfamily
VEAFPELAPVRGRVVISSLVGWRKPAPQFFDALVAAAECDRDQLLYVGDDERNDLDGATAAGLRAVLLDPAAAAPGANRIHRLRDLFAG